MTIDGAFLKLLNEHVAGGVVHLDSGNANMMAAAHGVVMEMNEWMHGIVEGIETGVGLMRYLRNAYYGPVVEDIKRSQATMVDGRMVAFVSDNYPKVPGRKAATHASRADAKEKALLKLGKTQAEVDAMTFSDESVPGARFIRCSSVLIYKGIRYVIRKLREELQDLRGARVYVSHPAPKNYKEYTEADAAERATWGMHELLSRGSEGEVPPVWDDGEGEVLARLYASWMRPRLTTERVRQPQIVIVSCDYDNIPMTLLLPREESVGLYVRVRSVQGQRRYINCEQLFNGVVSLRWRARGNEHLEWAWCATVAFWMAMRGSDYCAGIDRVGAATYWTCLIEAGRQDPDVRHLTIGKTDGRCVFDDKALCEFLRKVAPKIKPGIARERLFEGQWNVQYWSRIGRGPQPV